MMFSSSVMSFNHAVCLQTIVVTVKHGKYAFCGGVLSFTNFLSTTVCLILSFEAKLDIILFINTKCTHECQILM